MTCGSAREALLDLARGVAMPESVRHAVEGHMKGCAGCAADLRRQRSLTAALNTLSTEAQGWQPSPGIEDRLRSAFAAQTAAAGSPGAGDARSDRWVYVLAAAAVLTLAVWVGTRNTSVPPVQEPDVRPPAVAATPRGPDSGDPAAAPKVTAGVKPSGRVASANRARRPRPAAPVARIRPFEFVTLPGAAGLPELESGSVVRIEVPVAALPGYGMDIVPGALTTTVEADVLVGQDGQPRAIRLVTAEEQSVRETRSRQ